MVAKRNSSRENIEQAIEPMLAKDTDHAFTDVDWIFEIKWDGYRAIAECGKNKTLFYSRNGISFADKYPLVYNELKKIKTPMILDGEVVVFDENNKPSFQKLQHYEENKHLQIFYYVFDILNYKGEDVKHKPLVERKNLLKEVLPANDVIRYCDHVEKDGEAFFNEISEADMEGIIAKKKDSQYFVGKRTSNWLKIKHQHIEEVVITGFTAPRGGRKNFGALVLGRYKNGKLEYAGHTGTGFNEKLLKELYDKLMPLKTDSSPFDKKVPVNNKVTWVQPYYVANIRYTELTNEGIMRHPVFQGLRIDKNVEDMGSAKTSVKKTATVKNNADISPKETKKTSSKQSASSKVAKQLVQKEEDNKIITVEKQQLELTHLKKVYFPDDGITKGDIINYYNSVSKYILPYLKDRPESLKRNPNGIRDDGFFQKDMKETAPDWAETITLHSDAAKKDIEYFLCNNKSSLLYLANLGCIEINPWNSTIKNLDNPDYLILDIDPSDKNTFDEVVDIALIIKEILDKAGAASYCKTSGSSGLHIYVPLDAQYSYDECRMFAELLAHLTVEQAPEIATTERALNKRNDKMYIDFLQNKRGQTLASVYSVRPRRGATVSMPLEWKEVKRGLHPSQFTIKNAVQRIERKGDLFKGVLGKGIDLQKCLHAIENV